VRRWTSIKDVKDLLNSIVHISPSKQHLFYRSNMSELRNSTTLFDLGIEDDGSTLFLAVDFKTESNFILSCSDDILKDPDCASLVAEVKKGLERNRAPAKSDELDGTSGVYFFRSSSGAHLAVFKPMDEEQGMPNNPKGIFPYFHY